MGLARRNYNRLWKQVAPDYGQRGQPPPAFNPVPKGQGDAYVSAPDTPVFTPERAVNISPQMRRMLKKNPDNAQFTLLHEWSHVFGAGSEGHANRAANLATRDLRNKLARKTAQRKIRKTLNVPD